MEISSPRWLSEFGMEDPDLDYLLDDLNFDQTILSNHTLSDKENLNSQITSQNNSASPISTETTKRSSDPRSQTQPKANWISPDQDLEDPKTFHFISFNDSAQYELEIRSDWNLDNYHWPSNKKGDPALSRRTQNHALYHVLAEKKRREKVNQRFIALSAAIPRLKKTDKASILEEALKYLKQQEARLQKLEERATKLSMESAVILKKSWVHVYDDDSDGCCHKPLPEMDARVLDKEVLIRIHCENHKGCSLNLVNQVEKLHLSVINCQVLPFGKSTISITIVAKMEADYCMTVKDLLLNLRQILPTSECT